MAEIDDAKVVRAWRSPAPAHPEPDWYPYHVDLGEGMTCDFATAEEAAEEVLAFLKEQPASDRPAKTLRELTASDVLKALWPADGSASADVPSFAVNAIVPHPGNADSSDAGMAHRTEHGFRSAVITAADLELH